MKNTFAHLFSFLLLLSFGVSTADAQTIDLGLFRKTANSNQLDVRLRSSENVTEGAYSGGIFTVRFPSAYGVTLSVAPNTALYSYAFAGPVGHVDGYDYYRFQFAGSVNTVNWEKGTEYRLMSLQINGASPKNARFDLVTNTPWTRANNADFYQELNGTELQRSFYQMPVKVRAFMATAQLDRSVKLEWEFETETELSYSEVEYSVDGLGFGLIHTAAAQNVADRNTSEYLFVHGKPQAGINYYRIKMVDINGGVEYSQVRAINFDDLNAEFSVFPNPTAGPLTLVSSNLAKYAKGVQYQLIDNTGKIILSDNIKDDNMTLDLSKMASGAYYVKIVSDLEQLAKFQVVVAN